MGRKYGLRIPGPTMGDTLQAAQIPGARRGDRYKRASGAFRQVLQEFKSPTPVEQVKSRDHT